MRWVRIILEPDTPLAVAEVAERRWQRLVGLLGRPSLPAGSAMMIPRSGAVHTCFMRFPIDLLFLDRERTVIRIVTGVRPWRVVAARGAYTVIEFAAGVLSSRSIALGHRIRFEPT